MHESVTDAASRHYRALFEERFRKVAAVGRVFRFAAEYVIRQRRKLERREQESFVFVIDAGVDEHLVHDGVAVGL